MLSCLCTRRRCSMKCEIDHRMDVQFSALHTQFQFPTAYSCYMLSFCRERPLDETLPRASTPSESSRMLSCPRIEQALQKKSMSSACSTSPRCSRRTPTARRFQANLTCSLAFRHGLVIQLDIVCASVSCMH